MALETQISELKKNNENLFEKIDELFDNYCRAETFN